MTESVQLKPDTNLTQHTSAIGISENDHLVKQAQKLYDQHISPGTRRAYDSDWKIFIMWCQTNSFQADTATPETIALFLTDQFQDVIQPSTLTRRMAAIKFIFTQQQKTSPTDHPVVRNLLKGIRRDENAKPSQAKKAIDVSLLKEMVDLCPLSRLSGIRDKAIFLLGFSGTFRRSELTHLNTEDITWQDKGIDIKIRRSKTDQEGKGKMKSIIKAKDKNYCPCAAITHWIEKSKITTGALFRGITKNHQIKDNSLSDDGIYALIKHYSIAAGHNFEDFNPHSLRSGFITAALEANALPSKIMEITHHASFKSMQPYIKHAKRYEQHAGENLL